MTKIRKLDQAAARIAELIGDPYFTIDNLIRLAEQELLGICFKYRGDIAMTWEHSPDGSCKEVGTIPFNGFVKLMQPPTTDQVIGGFGVLVSIISVDTHLERSGQPYRLPVPPPHRGLLKPGYKVVGFIEETEVTRDKWWLCDDDLNQIIASDAASPQNTDAPVGRVSAGPASETTEVAIMLPPADALETTTAGDSALGTAPPADTVVTKKHRNRKPSWETLALPYLKKLYAKGSYRSATVFCETVKRRVGEPDSPFKLVDRELFCVGAGTVADGTFKKIWKKIRVQ